MITISGIIDAVLIVLAIIALGTFWAVIDYYH